MSIMIIHQSSELYGSDKTMLEFCIHCKKINQEIIVVLPNQGPLSEMLFREGISIEFIPIIKLHRGMFSPNEILKNIKSLLFIRSRYKKIIVKYSITKVISNTLAVLDGALLKLIGLNIKHVWHVHEILYDIGKFNRVYAVLLNRYTDKIIANSRSTYDYILEISGKESEVVHNGVDTEKFIKCVKCKNRVKPRLTVGLVGRINDWKGHLLLLSAISELKRTDLSLKFKGSFCASKETFASIQTGINNLSDDIEFSISDFEADVLKVWGDIDICVVPSIKPEPFGLVVIEAMAAGIPVIGSGEGGPSEIIEDGYTGILFEPRNPKALAAAINRMLDDETLRNTLSSNALARVNSHFTIKKYNEDLFCAIENS